MLITPKYIRNFSIIAHINHGKSTLADRFIQIGGGLYKRDFKDQVLDSMDIERERGITIKSQAVTLLYKSKQGKKYRFNLIDTPGHVDFTIEVERSLYACEGALLIIDACQGIEAQSLNNFYTAFKRGLKIIPVVNKIDLPQSNPKNTIENIEKIFNIKYSNVCCISSKVGLGINILLEKLIKYIPAPKGDPYKPLQALIIDSWFTNYLGVISLIRIKDGTIKKGDKILIKSTGHSWYINTLGLFTPKRYLTCKLSAGEVGFIVAGIKDIHGAPVGDTITHANTNNVPFISGFKKINSKIYAGVYPVNIKDYKQFSTAIEKLALNDASLNYIPENSNIYGCGFRIGFIGNLHLEIVKERIEREYGINLIITLPTVEYKIKFKNGKIEYIYDPSKIPENYKLFKIYEPIVLARIIVPKEYVGKVIKECIKYRGKQIDMFLIKNYIKLIYELPMAEVITNFFNRLKSVSKGYASLDYEVYRFKKYKLVRLDILINNNRIEALTRIVPFDKAYKQGKSFLEKIKILLSKQLFDIKINAVIGKKIIAKSKIKALRKNVTAKCYGGDITRKKKLIEKQKEGKKRMKKNGSIEINKNILFSLLNQNIFEKGK
ncbi:translation elongation factor 4 [Candidatus Portiera aleyrodidarum]|uniref:Elongation factor 4 n=1 Tax=Candidatus Portiera aleyrodidarum TaxID=91844 RepID=A0A6S6RT56_9GAMM|nr:translation elongation factor 4 [Candidatus Portiera aleyrodidarum]CAA3705377.1 Elongation factor 4 [Candidatus Portiera aleyrodidarum]